MEKEPPANLPAVDDWRNRAECRGEDPELFFPVGKNEVALRQLEEAKAICGRCAVMAECREWALTTGEDAGVWGGMSEDERRDYRRQLGLERRRQNRRAKRHQPPIDENPLAS